MILLHMKAVGKNLSYERQRATPPVGGEELGFRLLVEKSALGAELKF